MEELNITEIKEDFEKIRKYLNISKIYRLHLDIYSGEGFCDRYGHIIILGIEDGYSRLLLVHECVHATGMNHDVEKGYESVIRFDKYSKKLEKQIFNDRKV